MKIKITPEMRIRLMTAEHIVINIDDCLPDGWQLVPTDITTEMNSAWWNAINGNAPFDGVLLKTDIAAYKAMLAAAPKAALTADLIKEGGEA